MLRCDHKGTNSYTLLLLNLIFVQMKVYFKLIDINKYQCNAKFTLNVVTASTKSASVVDSI